MTIDELIKELEYYRDKYDGECSVTFNDNWNKRGREVDTVYKLYYGGEYIIKLL